MEPHPRRRGKRGERRGPERRTTARVRLHDVSQMAHPGEVRLRYLPPARGHAKDPAHVFAEGAQGLGRFANRPYTKGSYEGLFAIGRGAGPCKILTSLARTIRRSV